MSDRVVIDGDMSLTSTIDGEGNAFIRLGQNPVIEPLNATENGTYAVPEGVDGFNPVIVNTEVDALRNEIDSAIEASGCNPLVEGINTLTTYANETTGKSDATLSDAVKTLVDGYGVGELSELDIYVGLNASLQNVSFAQTLKKLNIVGTVSNSTLGRVPTPLLANNSVEVITVNYNSGWRPASCLDAFSGSNYQNLKKIVFNVDTSNVASWDRFLNGNNQLNQGFEFLGQPLNFSKMTKWNNVINIAKLKEIRFVPNTLSVSPKIADDRSDMFSNETWVSFANCFNDSESGTATIGSNAIDTISSIKGNVANGLFIADENGAMTLADFITNVKGWGLA